MAEGRRKGLLAAAIAVTGVAAVAVTGVTVFAARSGGGATPSPTLGVGTASPSGGTASASAEPAPVPVRRGWLSGAASDESANGSFGKWRGTAIQIGGTWDNGDSEQVAMRSICPGGPWATWNHPLDVAIGAIDVTRGDTWSAAADGAYNARWTKNLTRIKQCWGSRDPAFLYIRFAHEMNLNSIKWHVQRGEEKSFVKAITQYSTLRYKILPQAQIVLCPNDGTETGIDVRALWPGADSAGRPVANVYAVDSYNMNPHVTTAAEFTKKINGKYPDGRPLGIEKHREFAQSVGVPFAIGEWGNNGDPGNPGGGGESPLYIRSFYAWAASHAGDIDHPTAGQLLYEVHFNLWGQYAFWPRTVQPRTAAAYRALAWGTIPG